MWSLRNETHKRPRFLWWRRLRLPGGFDWQQYVQFDAALCARRRLISLIATARRNGCWLGAPRCAQRSLVLKSMIEADLELAKTRRRRLRQLPGVKLYIAGHRGMVGSALVRPWFESEPGVLARAPHFGRKLGPDAPGLRSDFFATSSPRWRSIAAAPGGGIPCDNTYPAGVFSTTTSHCREHVCNAAYRQGVKRVLVFGVRAFIQARAAADVRGLSAHRRVEPRTRPMPSPDRGPQTFQYYRAVRRVVPFGDAHQSLRPGDSYHPENSHVLPALPPPVFRRRAGRPPGSGGLGTGSPRREFPARGRSGRCLCVSPAPGRPPDWVNVGTGADVTIKELTELVAATWVSRAGSPGMLPSPMGPRGNCWMGHRWPASAGRRN